MTKMLFTSKGVQVVLGRELGKGGEGSVFEVQTLTNQVAKLYHKAPDPKKQAKLSFMASIADAQLLNYIAWPQETLHSSRDGSVIGFLMSKVFDRAPIHMIYSPAHRRQDYPKAAWDFLVHVARNIAASFETVHTHGHVIGDVNQNSFMVGRDSKVVLIDSDSFQVNDRGTRHLCGVGVSHFTPPELQSLSSFNGFVRTANHDNFGLALLIFHILFGGRHPFSGVPCRSGVGDALEMDIKNFRYAYATDHKARGFDPPPRSIAVSMLPNTMESMFHLAFTEKGASGVRPSSRQWVTALDGLRRRLKKCGVSDMHIYPDHLGVCPWCALEKQGVCYFLGARGTPTSGGFVLMRVWGLIQAVPPPPSVSIPGPGNFKVKARSLPAGIPSNVTITLIVVALAIGICIVVPKEWWINTLIFGGIGWAIANSVGSSKRAAETMSRQSAVQAACKEYDQIVRQVKKDAGPEGFHERRADLAKLKDKLEGLSRAETEEIDKLHATAHDRQKQRFLDNYFIDSACISGIGPARKAELRSFGIETAADVSKSRVMQVHGFGECLTRAVLDWKASCERQFKFNPAAAVLPSDRDAVHRSYLIKRAPLEAKLSAGPSQLQVFGQRCMQQAAMWQPRLEAAAKKLAQAQADLAAL